MCYIVMHNKYSIHQVSCQSGRTQPVILHSDTMRKLPKECTKYCSRRTSNQLYFINRMGKITSAQDWAHIINRTWKIILSRTIPNGFVFNYIAPTYCDQCRHKPSSLLLPPKTQERKGLVHTVSPIHKWVQDHQKFCRQKKKHGVNMT
jgi:hypothetical protein